VKPLAVLVGLAALVAAVVVAERMTRPCRPQPLDPAATDAIYRTQLDAERYAGGWT
jgi:hypothetical protein